MEGAPKNNEVGPEKELQNLEDEIASQGGIENIQKRAVSRFGEEWDKVTKEIIDLKAQLKKDSKNLKIISALVGLYKMVQKKNRQIEIEEYDRQNRPKGRSMFGNSPQDVGK